MATDNKYFSLNLLDTIFSEPSNDGNVSPNFKLAGNNGLPQHYGVGKIWMAQEYVHITGKLEYVLVWENVAGKTGPGQWFGMRSQSNANKDLLVRAWIRFVDKVPKPSSNFGLKVCGKFYNNFLSECKVDEWCRIYEIVHCTSGGDGNAIWIIFDTIAHHQVVQVFAMQIRPGNDSFNNTSIQ